MQRRLRVNYTYHIVACAAKAVLPILFYITKSQLLVFTRINHTYFIKNKKIIIKCEIFQVLFNKGKKDKLSLRTLGKKLANKMLFHHAKSITLYFLKLNLCADANVYLYCI